MPAQMAKVKWASLRKCLAEPKFCRFSGMRAGAVRLAYFAK
jgi:hypothetical protein